MRGLDGKFLNGTHCFDGLLKHPAVAEWAESYRSMNVRQNYLYALKKMVDITGVTPDELLSQEPAQAKQTVKKALDHYVNRGKHTFAESMLFTLKSFLNYHDRELKFKRQEKRNYRRVWKKIGVEVILDNAEVHRLATVAGGYSKRARAIILCLLQSGVRSSCLTAWTYGMVKDYLYPEVKVPVKLKITNQMDTKLLSYGLGCYYTFLNVEAAEALKAYIEERRSSGWQPKDGDPIFVTTAGKRMNYKLLWKTFKKAARNAGINAEGVWPHTLRKSFRKVLNRSRLDEDTKEALMGHKLPGSRENYFDRHDMDEVAEKYLTCNFSGEVESEEAEKEIKALKERLRVLEEVQDSPHPDYGDVKIPRDLRIKINQIVKDAEKFAAEAIKEKLGRDGNPPTQRNGGCPNGEGNNSHETRRVEEDELDSYFNEGWEFVSQINSGKVVVRRLRR